MRGRRGRALGALLIAASAASAAPPRNPARHAEGAGSRWTEAQASTAQLRGQVVDLMRDLLASCDAGEAGAWTRLGVLEPELQRLDQVLTRRAEAATSVFGENPPRPAASSERAGRETRLDEAALDALVARLLARLRAEDAAPAGTTAPRRAR